MTNVNKDFKLSENDEFKIMGYCLKQGLKPLYSKEFMLVCEDDLGGKVWVDMRGVLNDD